MLLNVIQAPDKGQAEGFQCPVCGDIMGANIGSANTPVFSDNYDTVTCLSCEEYVLNHDFYNHNYVQSNNLGGYVICCECDLVRMDNNTMWLPQSLALTNNEQEN